MNLIELGASVGPHWTLFLEVALPVTIGVVLVAYFIRMFWTPEKRRKYDGRIPIQKFSKNMSMV
jgi:hypothetical protein